MKYATFRSECDGVIDPSSSVALDGAVNTDAGCLGHDDLLGDGAVSQGVRDFLTAS